MHEPGNEEKERRNPGSIMAQCEKREEFSIEELGVEELGGGSWLLQDFLGDGDNYR